MQSYPVRLLLLTGTLLLSACAKYDFAPIPSMESLAEGGSLNQSLLANVNMSLAKSQATFTQLNYNQNDTTVTFQVIDSNGNYVNTVDSSQLNVRENGVSVPSYQLASNIEQSRQTVDMVFMVDITCSMKPTINSAKASLINFINSTRANGYRTRMCLLTFGDSVVQNCNRFYDNNPADPSTMTQVGELIAAINMLQAGCGAADPGGPTLDENPLAALIAAENAPWAQGSQRFGILMTDAGFLYAPGNDVGLVKANKYTDALASLQRSQMNVFAAAPSLPGYNQTFSGSPSIVSASSGEFFLYSDLVAGNTTFNNILNRILLRVQTTYSVSYTADTIPGLDPSLPLNQRTITITPKNGVPYTVRITGTTSSQPDGYSTPKKSWPLTDKQIASGSLVVRVNGQVMTSGYQITGGQIVFDVAPAKGANIHVEFQNAYIKDSLNIQPVVLNANVDLSMIAVFLNGMKASGQDLKFEKNLAGQWVMVLNQNVLSESDPYKIRAHGGLQVQVEKVDADAI